MTTRRLLALAAALVLSASAAAQDADLPNVKEGDTWTYKSIVEKGQTGFTQTIEEVVVSRVTASSIYYTAKESGSTQAPREFIAGRDWSRLRDVNGQQTVVSRPLSFPLAQGKVWDLHYSEDHPNKVHKKESWTNQFVVQGVEAVEVPAGKFNAIKVESEGTWSAQIEPGQSVVQGGQTNGTGSTLVTQVQKVEDRVASGRTYRAFWYVPGVKRWVKYVEEFYNSGGVRYERYSAELQSYNVN